MRTEILSSETPVGKPGFFYSVILRGHHESGCPLSTIGITDYGILSLPRKNLPGRGIDCTIMR